MFFLKKMHIVTFSLRIVIFINSMVRFHLRTLFWYINPSNMNFPNHLIAGLDFPQTFIPKTQGSPIWAVLMYFLTAILYGRNSVCISVIFTWNYFQNLHRNISFHKLTKNSLKKLLTLHFWENMFDMLLS